MTSKGINDHQRVELIAEGKRLGREELQEEQRLAEIANELGKLILAHLGATDYEEWPPVAKAAMIHLQRTHYDPALVYKFKQRCR